MAELHTLDVLLLSVIAAVTWYVYARGQRAKECVKVTVAEDEKLPDPDPLWDFDLATATTRNHLYVNKTVRWPYHQTMSHQPMHINDWIEIDKDYKWYIDEKARVIAEKGKHVIDSCPDNDEACGELMEILVDYLPKRYPTLFEKIDCEGGGIWNKVTDEKLIGLEGRKGVDALTVCSRLVQDDFLMGREREDGSVYFTGGLVAFPGFYLLSKKINKTLRYAHAPVPYFNEKLLLSVERTLKRFKPNEPFERTSWEIVDDRNLHWRMWSGAKLPKGFHPKDLFFRVDHQTFRKLPRTKGIIFGVHPIMKRLEDLEDSPLVPMLLAKVHAEADEKLMKYKVAPAYQDLMMPYLAELTARQIEKGLITYVAYGVLRCP
ncbi:hypothetical protein GLOTRDRAFT_47391 [Gloeophyllum trabeum ATCC 11539]|uniref:Uncharacterized protein n=1 Tax=Gloeophyllum trabeum (strain ATCC 11539 / FP-39264 / Madison 617) TaxID=670483 RepID=S7PXC7_GLOTA|nr:uncharacterized protein GLOTRDRAFT_47391 [Gloeophyllum trabeum ATCC 11539]EPQ52256.1 hypothetical protein GLOTRDRAFT_47391 [Gloeophyllum trabeum ATCC 11539]